MGADEIERWTKEDVVKTIENLAKSYTPEWKFDPSNPDAGTALALIFADMFYGTVKRYQGIREKLHRDFFVRTGQKLLCAVPAEGYVTFGLSTREFGGSYVQKGTSVKAAPDAEGKEAVYETAEALYVTPAEITSLIYMDGQEDYIEKKDLTKPFHPFLPEGENGQEHALYLREDEVLEAAGTAEIRLRLKQPDLADEKDWILDREEISVAYAGTAGFEEFCSRRIEGDCLILKAAEGAGAAKETKLFGKTGYWLRIRARKPWKREPFWVKDIRLSAGREDIEPDFIQNGMGEQKNDNFLPFGERPALFEECYFASREALGKTGARIRLTFSLDYERLPFDNHIHVEPKRKIIMKRDDFLPDPEYDITIEQVVWEYYNGIGWSRLALGEDSQSLFNGKSHGERIELEFECPKDAALLEWQCAPTRYIRVRVLRMDNLFKLKGAYITPVIHNVRFHYVYDGEERYPQNVIAHNQNSRREYPVRELKNEEVRWEIFYGPKQKYRRLYIGFDRPLSEGPVKLFIRMKEEIEEELPGLTFEYYGKKGFAPLTVYDETKGLRKSGCMTFLGKEDFSASPVCGESAYWIRVTDKRDLYRERKKTQKNPEIERMDLNTVSIKAVESYPDEWFHIKDGEKNKACLLLRGNIYDLCVWVLEGGDWIKWEETEDFLQSKETDRHYVLDKNRGIVYFSDGKRGRIPPGGEKETIRIAYRCGGGERGNQPPGAIESVGSAIGFVSRVTNPMPVCGGCGRESVLQAVRRGEETMRHAGRAVTASDYEAVAREASRLVQKVKCYGGYNAQGKYEPGKITLVVLHKDFRYGRMYFEKVREDIMAYLLERIQGSLAARGGIEVTEPQLLSVDCYVRVVAEDLDHIFEMQEEIRKRLAEFLDPVTGNYHKKGWEIGIIPNEAQILNALNGIEGIRLVRELRTTMSPVQKGVLDSRLRFALPLGGRCTVVVEANEDGRAWDD